MPGFAAEGWHATCPDTAHADYCTAQSNVTYGLALGVLMRTHVPRAAQANQLAGLGATVGLADGHETRWRRRKRAGDKLEKCGGGGDCRQPVQGSTACREENFGGGNQAVSSAPGAASTGEEEGKLGDRRTFGGPRRWWVWALAQQPATRHPHWRTLCFRPFGLVLQLLPLPRPRARR